MSPTPRYGGEPIIRMEGIVEDPAIPLLRQRRRLAGSVGNLDDEQWSTPSRCQGWSVKDVVSHLVTVNEFWAISIGSGVSGSPTRYLESFDPVDTPAQLVDAVRSQTPAETLERFVQSNESLASVVGSLDEVSWSAPAEAPPGHLAIRLVVLHALWDSWIHERDIVMPLGLPTVDEGDEVFGSLVYVAALGAAFRVLSGSGRTACVEVSGEDPQSRFILDIDSCVHVRVGPRPDGAVTIGGSSVQLLEALSTRSPFPAGVDPSDRWLLDGLTTAFGSGF
jgi:uncharacterized protein (TIGR03083 family)